MTVNEKKALKQAEANAAIDANGGFGLCACATGVGKSKIAVDRIFDLFGKCEYKPKILLIVPTEKLRDEGWKEEFIKWDLEFLWQYVERTCYASLDNYESEDWDLVVGDEIHHITPVNSIFFHNNTVKSCIGLTATPPTDPVKIKLLAEILHLETYTQKYKLKLIPTYEVTLDEAVELGIVAPYDITVIEMPLNNTVKYIKGGYKNKPKMMTEKERYDELTRMVNHGSNPIRHIIRMRFIYDLLSKTQTAVKIIENVIPKGIRTIFFCGSKDQANQVCPYRYYSKPTKPKMPTKLKGCFNGIEFDIAAGSKLKEYANYVPKAIKYENEIKEYQGNESYNLFFEEKINQLSSCEALNEGLNLPLVDCAFIIQLNSSDKDLVQRMGRILRQRDGHTGKIIILVVKDTVDIEWANKALMKLNQANIRRITVEDLRDGKEKINFN